MAIRGGAEMPISGIREVCELPESSIYQHLGSEEPVLPPDFPAAAAPLAGALRARAVGAPALEGVGGVGTVTAARRRR